KVAIVVRFLLAAHRARLATVGIEEPGFQHHAPAALDELDLAMRLELDRLLEEAKRVEVLDLATRAQRISRASHRDVGIAAKRALLHVAVADPDPAHERVQ